MTWRRLYGYYGGFLFFGVFLLLLPAFWLIIQRPAWHRYTAALNRLWARLVLGGCFLPVRIEREAPLPTGPCIYCANHTSFLDIPVASYILRGDAVFMGKSSLGKPPLFGWMFRNLHITVDRSSRMSGYRSLLKARAVVERGGSLIIFPEGGIPDAEGDPTHVPLPRPFKDGPFRLAIEQQIPIVPVTLVYNWYVLPDDGRFCPNWHPLRAVYHAPIPTEGLTLSDLPRLKAQTREAITQEMVRNFEPSGVRPSWPTA